MDLFIKYKLFTDNGKKAENWAFCLRILNYVNYVISIFIIKRIYYETSSRKCAAQQLGND